MKKDAGVFFAFINPRSFLFTIAIIFFLVFGAASVIAHQHYRSTLRHTIDENKSTASILSSLIYEHQKAAIGILESYASCNGFIQKPFQLEKLSGKVREMLDLKGER